MSGLLSDSEWEKWSVQCQCAGKWRREQQLRLRFSAPDSHLLLLTSSARLPSALSSYGRVMRGCFSAGRLIGQPCIFIAPCRHRRALRVADFLRQKDFFLSLSMSTSHTTLCCYKVIHCTIYRCTSRFRQPLPPLQRSSAHHLVRRTGSP